MGYDSPGNTGSSNTQLNNEKGQVGLYCSIGLEVSESDNSTGIGGNNGHDPWRREDCVRPIPVVNIGTPGLLAAQGKHTIKIAFLVFSEIDCIPHALNLTASQRQELPPRIQSTWSRHVGDHDSSTIPGNLSDQLPSLFPQPDAITDCCRRVLLV